jgi:leader peptidase (prepilin peptidase) / N-methyltransferase
VPGGDALSLWLSPPVLALLGLCIGSFLNVVVHRLPRMMEREWLDEVAQHLKDGEAFRNTFREEPPKLLSEAGEAVAQRLDALPGYNLWRPRSACPKCGHQIRWYENLPVVGWLSLRGRCSACKTPISWRYPAMELTTGALFALAAWRYGAQPVTLLWCAVIATLLALAAIDWDTTLLPESMTLPLIGGGLAAAAMGWTVPLPSAVAGALVGYLSLWSIYWLFKLTTGKEGMGYGDFKLLCGLGAWLGLPAILPIVLMSSVVGSVVGLGLKFSGGLRQGLYVPFGPFLAGGGLIVILVGSQPIYRWLGW